MRCVDGKTLPAVVDEVSGDVGTEKDSLLVETPSVADEDHDIAEEVFCVDGEGTSLVAGLFVDEVTVAGVDGRLYQSCAAQYDVEIAPDAHVVVEVGAAYV